MQTNLAPQFLNDPAARSAEAILRKCVHCGFCLATCPSYQVLGDERDSPRGRIYLIKQVLEGQAPGRSLQQHLDRCLTCRNCETTCPSGVAYGHLVDIGREWVEARVPRPLGERVKRALLREGLNSPFFAPALRLGQWLRPLLPAVLRAKVPPRHTQDAQPHRAPVSPTKGAVLMPAGCVQPALRPQIDAATARVLAACGWEVLRPPGGTCCGALRTHLGDAAGGLAQARANIDAWWPYVDPQRPGGPVEAIVSNASGCGVQLKEYGERLAGDPQYAERARLVSARVRDLAEVVAPRQDTLKARLAPGADGPAGQLAVHVPCTLQHGQRLPRVVRDLLTGLGFATEPSVAEGHLCCGSAGTYSVLQPEIATALRDRKLRNLQASHPAQIVSANIGCIQHLQSGTSCPVRHWVELVADVLPA